LVDKIIKIRGMSRFFNITDIFLADQTGRLGRQQSTFGGTPETCLPSEAWKAKGGTLNAYGFSTIRDMDMELRLAALPRERISLMTSLLREFIPPICTHFP